MACGVTVLVAWAADTATRDLRRKADCSALWDVVGWLIRYTVEGGVCLGARYWYVYIVDDGSGVISPPLTLRNSRRCFTTDSDLRFIGIAYLAGSTAVSAAFTTIRIAYLAWHQEAGVIVAVSDAGIWRRRYRGEECGERR